MTDTIGMQLERSLIGQSHAMRKLRALIERVGPSKLPVLIQGPTGAGKELVARGLHAASGRDGAFVAVNVCAIGDTMLEDALFGHVKGAFTGASCDSIGYFAEANGGTVFLDEVNGMPVASQAKLLRAVETGEFRAVGASRDRVSDFRVVAATNEDLSRSVTRGSFRQDLRYRLGGVVLTVPALADRREDIPVLAKTLLARAVGGAFIFTEQAIVRLQAHRWPGNVRELKHVVERSILYAKDGTLNTREVEVALQSVGCRIADVMIDDSERERLLALLTECEGDTEKAAERLGVHRTTVYRRMHRLGLTLESTAIASGGGCFHPSDEHGHELMR